MLVGQQRHIAWVNELIAVNRFPRFLILVGALGSGRRTLAGYIATKLDAYTYCCGLGMAAIRGLRECCSQGTSNVCYMFSDADNMSREAMNALLKLAEEPPGNAYLILMLEDEDNLPATLLSRGTVIHMLPYTPTELIEYLAYVGVTEFDERLFQLAETPGECMRLHHLGVTHLFSACGRLLDDIVNLSGVDTLRYAEVFQLAKEKTGYEPLLFLRCFRSICYQRYSDAYGLAGYALYWRIAQETSRALRDLKIAGISKGGVVDEWLLTVRDIRKDHAERTGC